jgi:hypothetical protein
MTVLQRKEATGVDSARLAKMVGSVALIGAIGLGVGFALTSVDSVETLAPAEIESQAQGLAKSAEANQALSGASVAAVTGPFLAGHPSQTHKGRNVGAPAAKVESSAVGDPISDRIPDYPQSTTGSAGTSGEASGFGNGEMFAR